MNCLSSDHTNLNFMLLGSLLEDFSPSKLNAAHCMHAPPKMHFNLLLQIEMPPPLPPWEFSQMKPWFQLGLVNIPVGFHQMPQLLFLSNCCGVAFPAAVTRDTADGFLLEPSGRLCPARDGLCPLRSDGVWAGGVGAGGVRCGTATPAEEDSGRGRGRDTGGDHYTGKVDLGLQRGNCYRGSKEQKCICGSWLYVRVCL